MWQDLRELVKVMVWKVQKGDFSTLETLLPAIRFAVTRLMERHPKETRQTALKDQYTFIGQLCPFFRFRDGLTEEQECIGNASIAHYLFLHIDQAPQITQRLFETKVCEEIMREFPEGAHLGGSTFKNWEMPHDFQAHEDLEHWVLPHAGKYRPCPACQTSYYGSVSPVCPKCGHPTLFTATADQLQQELERRENKVLPLSVAGHSRTLQ